MSELQLSITQCLNLICASGADKTYIVEGPMGSGKSSMVKMAEARFGDKYNYVTVDCTQLDVGDVQIPDVDRANGVTRFVPNQLFVGDGSKPMFINLDEIGKASRSVQNALLPILLERRVGCVKLPAGSIVFGCTNLGAEGVGDMFQPHARNRVSFLTMRAPTVEEWLPWGMQNVVPPAMLAWVSETPQLLHTFERYPNPDSNSYIFHPKAQRRSFVTPRSLYLASIDLRDDVRAAVGDPDATLAALAGNLGPKAALDLMAFVQLADQMPAWDSIIKAPEVATLATDNAAALVVTVFSCVARVEKKTLAPVLTYIKRMPTEIQCMFATQLLRSGKAFAALDTGFTKFIRDNHWALL